MNLRCWRCCCCCCFNNFCRVLSVLLLCLSLSSALTYSYNSPHTNSLSLPRFVCVRAFEFKRALVCSLCFPSHIMYWKRTYKARYIKYCCKIFVICCFSAWYKCFGIGCCPIKMHIFSLFSFFAFCVWCVPSSFVRSRVHCWINAAITVLHLCVHEIPGFAHISSDGQHLPTRVSIGYFQNWHSFEIFPNFEKQFLA